jgi:hypothetical protein
MHRLRTPMRRNLARVDTLRIHECIETAPLAMAAMQAAGSYPVSFREVAQTRIAESVSRALAACAALLCCASFPATAGRDVPIR